MSGKEPSPSNPADIPGKVFNDTLDHLLGNNPDEPQDEEDDDDE